MFTLSLNTQEAQSALNSLLGEEQQQEEYMPVTIVKFLDSCYFKQVDKVVVKVLCINDAFVDMDLEAMQVWADAIILPYIREAQESSHQRFTVIEMMVKKRYQQVLSKKFSTFVEAVRFHVTKYIFHSDPDNE
ncbi:hypothetical protein G6F56_010767 [Rhizopus delemar]|nr:hypothetical protein G6F56_010767 [Rhizopus delemar]